MAMTTMSDDAFSFDSMAVAAARRQAARCMELCEPFFVNARNTMGYDIGVNSLKSVRCAAKAFTRIETRGGGAADDTQWRRCGATGPALKARLHESPTA